MPKTLDPKVLALDKELVPWFTQSEASAACVPRLLLCFSSVINPFPEALDTPKILSLTQPWLTSLMLDLSIWLLLV